MAKKPLPVSVDQLPLPFDRSSLFPIGDHRQIVNIAELSRLTGFPPDLLYEWTRHNRIPGAMQTAKGTRWRFRRDEVERWWLNIRRT